MREKYRQVGILFLYWQFKMINAAHMVKVKIWRILNWFQWINWSELGNALVKEQQVNSGVVLTTLLSLLSNWKKSQPPHNTTRVSYCNVFFFNGPNLRTVHKFHSVCNIVVGTVREAKTLCHVTSVQRAAYIFGCGFQVLNSFNMRLCKE